MPHATIEEAWKEWSPTEVKKHKVAIYSLPNGQFQAYIATSNNIPTGARKLEPQPPYPKSKDPRAGTKKAMELLEANHPTEIQLARRIAVEIAQSRLTVHSRMVRDEMARRGLIGPDTGSEFWLGAAMGGLGKQGILKDTGTMYKYSDEARNIHERKVAIWTLVDGADVSKYPPVPADQKAPGAT